MKAVAKVAYDAYIWPAAKLPDHQNGHEAPIHVATRADELLAEGVVEGQFTCKLIMRAMEDVLRGRETDPLQ